MKTTRIEHIKKLYSEGCNYNQIAKVIGCHPGTIRNILLPAVKNPVGKRVFVSFPKPTAKDIDTALIYGKEKYEDI